MSITTAPKRATPPEPPEREGAHLQAALQQRHLTMIALGGVIGAGLFVGSGAVISVTGPAAVLSYVLAGVLVVLVMRMLGEMAAAHPKLGSFTELIRRSLGEGAGFTSGWLYWYFWVIVVGFEAVAGASILQRWVDGPLWLMALVLTILMTATNMWSVRAYGEFEFWFASIKVATIVVFLLIGSAYVLGLWPDKDASFANLTAHDGFVPEGAVAIFSGIVVVIFSMVGAEIVTIAAAESKNPAQAIAKATNAVVSRILLFFVGSIFLLVTILPWNDAKLGDSPYVAAFEVMGIPAAADIMNAVVLTAVLSCLNSGIYTASRVLRSLSRKGDAPHSLLAVNARGVPVKAIVACTGVAYIGIALRLHLAGHGLPVPPELLRRDRAVRLLPHLRRGAADAASARTRHPGADPRADVAVPVAHLSRDGRDRRGRRVDVLHRGQPLAAAPQLHLARGGGRRLSGAQAPRPARPRSRCRWGS